MQNSNVKLAFGKYSMIFLNLVMMMLLIIRHSPHSPSSKTPACCYSFIDLNDREIFLSDEERQYHILILLVVAAL